METPSGPVRVPYDPVSSPSGGHSMPYEGMTSPSGSHRTDRLPQPPATGDAPGTYDSLAGSSGPYPSSASGPYDSLASSSGPYTSAGGSSAPSYDSLSSPSAPSYDSLASSSGPYDSLGGASGPQQPPFGASGPQQQPFGAPPPPTPPARDFDDDLDGGSGPRPQPILPLTTDSRTSGAAPWPLPTPDDLADLSRNISAEVSKGSLTSLPPVEPRTGKSRRRREDDEGLWMRGGRPTPLAIGSSVAAVAVVAGALAVVLTGGSGEAPVSAAPSAASTAAQAGRPSPVPNGYKEHAGPRFTAAVPQDWKLSVAGGVATFSGPKDSNMRIVVEKAVPQPDGGVAELGKLEAEGGRENYIQVRLQAVKYRGTPAADWEYTYTTDQGVPMHALVRYAALGTELAHKITFDLPDLRWDEQAATRKVFLDTFQPVA
ncbi:hypothetical protein ACFMQL_02695 [Nonomuraea fastidiosa]|uniref:hypothetical protein n=1 Tax=Nonomuraea fastidiosa TaxID=46173 RepID=UPI00366CA95C